MADLRTVATARRGPWPDRVGSGVVACDILDGSRRARLLGWAARFSPPHTWAIEGATGMGALLDQQFVAAGEHVVDVPPKLSSRVRLLEHGRIDKTDPNDVAACDVEARRVCRIMEQFRVESSMSELGTVRLSVHGELEATTADMLVDALCQWLGIRECVVDLGGCDFVDSAGIRALIECRHQIGPDAPMRLVGLSPQVERTLRRVGLDQLLTFEPASTDAASSPETNGTADVH